MPSKDLHNNVDERIALNFQTINSDTTTNGVIIDTQGFESVEFVVPTGTVSAGDVTPALQEGDDSGLSDAATVSSDNTIGSLVTLDAANGITRVGYVGKKRYVRLNAVTDNSANLQVGGIVILSNPHSAPVAQ